MSIEKAIAKAREIEEPATVKPWRYAQLLDGIEARALLDGSGYLFGRCDDLENGALIVHATNTHKLVWDVVESGHWLLDVFLEDSTERASAALALKRDLDALAKAVNGGE